MSQDAGCSNGLQRKKAARRGFFLMASHWPPLRVPVRNSLQESFAGDHPSGGWLAPVAPSSTRRNLRRLKWSAQARASLATSSLCSSSAVPHQKCFQLLRDPLKACNPGLWRENRTDIREFIESTPSQPAEERIGATVWSLLLTAWAEVRSPASEDDPPDRRPADQARFTCSEVNAMFELEEPLFAFRVHVIGNRRAA